jgi:hypothetical protein
MSTCRELSVCATKVGENGTVLGATVTTVTSGTGRVSAPSREQPARAIRAVATTGIMRLIICSFLK